MAENVFDIESLAAYLHLTTAQIARLAERGKLPGRRVGGQWRFSGAEIHHWLEERIGAGAEEELVRVEGALQVPGGTGEQELSLVRMLPLEAIEVPLAARTRNSVVSSMVQVAARTGWLWDPERMAEAVRSREDMHPTALENGVALLHPRRPMPSIVEQALLALGRTEAGIPFGGSRGVLTDVFFLICSTDDRRHLRVLARLSRLIGAAGFLDEVRAAPDAHAIRALFVQREQGLSG